MRIALTHRFFSEGHVGRDEAESNELVHRAFVALRLIKPTRSRFSSIQYKITDSGNLNVFSLTHPNQLPVNAPDSEALNRIDTADLLELKGILPHFERVFVDGPEGLQRAVRYYEMAYSTIFPSEIQFLTWVMGIESAVAERESALKRSDLIQRILKYVPAETLIYADSPLNEFLKLPALTIGDVVADIFKLRSRLTHGGWMPDWRSGFVRPSLAGQDVVYAEMLREAAPFLLRKLIVSSLKTIS